MECKGSCGVGEVSAGAMQGAGVDIFRGVAEDDFGGVEKIWDEGGVRCLSR